MNRYTIRDFKYGDTECPMSKLQDLENKIEDGVLVKASDVAREIFAEIEKVIGDKYECYVFDNINIEGVEQDAIIAFVDAMSNHFAERLKAEAYVQKPYGMSKVVDVGTIDRIAKEILNENTEE